MKNKKKRNGKFLDLMWIIISIINIFNNFYMYEIKNNVYYFFVNYLWFMLFGCWIIILLFDIFDDKI